MEISEIIRKAILEDSEIEIVYTKYDGTVSKRVLSNINYSDEFGPGYISAFCHKRQEQRTFKIDRICKVEVLSDEKRLDSSAGEDQSKMKTEFMW